MNLDIEPDNHLSLDMQISTQHDHANDVRADLVNSEYGHQSSCDIVQLLAFSVQHKASDLHLSADLPPMVRIDGDITRINLAALDSNDVHNKIAQMYSAIQTGQDVGMQTLDQCLQRILQQGVITREEALLKAAYKDNFT